MQWNTLADSANAVITSAANGAAPGVIAVIGIVVGIAVVIHILRKAGR
ncbi:MAG TPA: hypothetical protein VMR41_03235 [Patescibacteria group bacterium]|jgi:uncharacterized membrane protein|nr:hypothetical protein [Patescibacteria group bacterium]